MAKRPVPKYDFKAFGAAIKAARTGRKESRKKVSDEMFISPRYLANIENKGQHPSLQIFFELMLRYNIKERNNMPKIFSEHERSAIQASMLEVGAELLKRKGIKQVSVEDIAKGVHIAKGTFYSFYHSREELLWDVIQVEEQHIVDEILFFQAGYGFVFTKVIYNCFHQNIQYHSFC